ncbi:hypothetical protein NQ318_004616, partial [Aromia moschata]
VLRCNMKCTPIRLSSRSEYNKSKWKYDKTFHRNIEPVFITNECHGNLGGLEEDFDMTFGIHNILDCLDDSGIRDDADTLNEDVYEVNSDIEELLKESMEIRQIVEQEGFKEKEKSAPYKKRKESKRKHKFKRTIRFSLSKPPSPNTEQIIRVDVTSNVSVDELRHPLNEKGIFGKDNCGNAKMTNGSGKDFDSGYSENGAINSDGDDEEFIIRCSQLALAQRGR